MANPLHLIEDHPTHFKLSNGAVFPKNAQTMCQGGIYDFVSKQAQMHADGDVDVEPAEAAGTGDTPESAPVDEEDSPEGDAQATTPAPTQDVEAPTPPPVPQPTVPQPAQPAFPSMQSTKVERTVADPALLQQGQALAGDEANQVKKQGDAAAELQQLQGQSAQKQSEIAQADAQRHQQAAITAQAQYQDYAAKRDAMQQDISNTKLTPKSIFTGDAAHDIAAGFALALGGMSGGLNGTGVNPALQIFQKTIDRDLEVQKANLENKRANLNSLGQAYQAARQAGFDDQQAKDLASADQLKAIAARFQALGANAQSADVKAKAAQAADQILRQANQQEQSVMSAKVTTETTPIIPQQKMSEAQRNQIGDSLKNDNNIQALRDAKKAMQMNNEDLGKAPALVDRLRTFFGVEKADPAQIKQLATQLATDNSFSSRLSPDMQALWAQQNPQLSDPPEVFDRKLNTIDQQNAKTYMQTFDRTPYQRDESELPLKSTFYRGPQVRRSAGGYDIPASQTIPLSKKHR